MIMRYRNKLWSALVASVCTLLLYACAGVHEDMEQWSNGAQGSTDSRASTPVTASVALTETSRLTTQLAAALGNEAQTVQELTISGIFYAEDVEYLHTLKALEKLDMTDVSIQENDEHPYYEFSYSFININDNIQKGNVYGYLQQDVISPQMFIGMTSLIECKLPVTVNNIEGEAFMGCTSLTSIDIPGNIQKIGYSAFSNTSLTTVTIPEGVTYLTGFQHCRQLKNIHLPSTLTEIGYDAFWFCSSLENINIPASVTTLGSGAFSGCSQLKSLTIPETVTQIDGSIVDNCSALQFLIWNTTQPVQGQQPNENCLLYINSSNGVAATYDANAWSCAIVDGVADNIRLSFSRDKHAEFHCPIAFTAKRISLTMNFGWIWTYEGKASGWRPLTLPFNVTSITSEEKGALAPFGSQVPEAKPFWLRRLTADGFVDVTSIEADQPYIIAMPNNPELYLDEYNITGNVVFEGENAYIPATPDELPAVEGPDYYLQPTYRFVGRSRTVYALNYDYYIRGYEQGGVFAHTSSPVYAYEAYVKEKPGSTTRAYYGIDTRSPQTRTTRQKNTSGIPAVGDM